MAKGGTGARLMASRLLAVLFSVCAFAGLVLVYRHTFNVGENNAVEQESAQGTDQPVTAAEEVETYQGVEDPWIGGLFTTGNQDLDVQVKAFCDALTTDGLGVTANAQIVFDQIAWSNYLERAEEDIILTSGWDVIAAQQFFSSGVPEEGVGGNGDYYEFSAAIAFCLRYFGFSDALVAPVVTYPGTSYEGSGALVLVTSEAGTACVCDPSLAAEGWMVDRYQYDIVIEDLGEDLSPFEALGYTIQERRSATTGSVDDGQNEENAGEEGDAQGGDSANQQEDEQSQNQDEYGGYDSYNESDDYGEY